ncbi:MAG: sigma 54-interacting transcriptional regulator [Desulfobacterota bacterium]|nr:sigma 54-interacting transcriptional regulator [Thermodesulfobacteriota bacterium]
MDRKDNWPGIEAVLRPYLLHTTPPVTIDTLCELSGAPVLPVLNVMENLRRKGLVTKKKGLPRGVYFPNPARLKPPESSGELDEPTRKALHRIIDYYNRTMAEGEAKILVLAELYRKLGEPAAGDGVLKQAAGILRRTGRSDQAQEYYDLLLKKFRETRITAATVGDFLDSALGKIAAAKHLLPIPEQVALLTRAERAAQRFQRWDVLPKIKLALGNELQAAGQDKKAFRYMGDFWRLAERVGDPRMLKMATLMMGEFLHWKGKFAEVVRRYEEVLEDLEEFGDDEATLRAIARVGLCYVRCGRIARGMGMIDGVRAKAELLPLPQIAIFSDLMALIALFELRKIAEAEVVLNRLSALPEEQLGHYILWPVEACQGYIRCMGGDYDGAFAHLQRAVEHSRYVGWLHQNGAWNFELLDMLEARGLVHPEWNYRMEIQRMLRWDDIYMRGVSYRYRALRLLEKQQPLNRVLADLKKSEKYLEESGAEIELARTRIALGNLTLKKGELKAAHAYLGKAWRFFSNVDQNLFPKDLLAILPQEQKMEVLIDRIVEINESLGTLQDLSSFLERAINLALDLTMARRGAFFTPGADGKLALTASRNLDPAILRQEQVSRLLEVVQETARLGREVVLPGLSPDVRLSETALLEAGIHSLICRPVRLAEQIHGYLYLDNRLGRKPFPADNLPLVRLIGNQIAVGLTNIRIYDEIKVRRDRLEDETIFYRRELGLANPAETLIGRSEKLKRIMEQIRQVAPADSSVLILGETGVGKELVAKAIHNWSQRKDGPFIPVNLVALPPDLVASELFGHEKGAFTGAVGRHKGRFELADRGTIFLDEIGDLSPQVQVKLLRVLQEGSFERLGSGRPVLSDFRVVAATNQDLQRLVREGRFREDLYYRLNVFPIQVPPLRERREDVPLLAQYFLEQCCQQTGKQIKRIPGEELKKLLEYPWPGNVRELKHFIERAVILAEGPHLAFSGLHPLPLNRECSEPAGWQPLADVEREYLEKVLQATRWKVSGRNGAAAILGLKPTTLFFRMKKLGLQK